VNPRLQALLFCWCQEAFFSKEHRGPAPLTVPGREKAFTFLSKSENARFSNEGRKAITCYSAGSTRSLAPPRYTEAQPFMLHLLAEE
jgi:hypothetical protein